MDRISVTKKAIGARLRLAREQAGLSQAQAARLMGLHRPSVSETEAGRRNVTAEELSRFARLYDVRLDWLACVDDPNESLETGRLELAARELQKLRPEDLDRLMALLSTLRRGLTDR